MYDIANLFIFCDLGAMIVVIAPKGKEPKLTSRLVKAGIPRVCYLNGGIDALKWKRVPFIKSVSFSLWLFLFSCQICRMMIIIGISLTLLVNDAQRLVLLTTCFLFVFFFSCVFVVYSLPMF